MAAAAPSGPAHGAAKVFQTRFHSLDEGDDESRREIEAAIAKAVELKTLHAALMSRNSSANRNFKSPSPSSTLGAPPLFQDYPSCEDEEQPVYRQASMAGGKLSKNWSEKEMRKGNGNRMAVFADHRKLHSSSSKGFSSDYFNLDTHIFQAQDCKSVYGPSTNHLTVLQSLSRNDFIHSARRNSLRGFKSTSASYKSKPTILSKNELEKPAVNDNNSTVVVPTMNSHSSQPYRPKIRKMISWVFWFRKKIVDENTSIQTKSEEVVQSFTEIMTAPIEKLKKKLMKANETRDLALMDVSEMKSSLGELRKKLDYLESNCEELRKASRQAKHSGDLQIDRNGGSSLPVSEEVIAKAFSQMASQARFSSKQFCKILTDEIEEGESNLMENLNSLLQAHKIPLNPKNSKTVLYHLEAIINQSLYQDFENCVFEQDGSTKLLDPQENGAERFLSYVALRNLSWSEVSKKGTKFYSEEFSRFCDRKMSCIIKALRWPKPTPWPEKLLQAFFNAAKSIWLAHSLAFLSNPPLGILRVKENFKFDPRYMEEMSVEKSKSHRPSQVKIMVTPGFYVHDQVLKCKVICKNVP